MALINNQFLYEYKTKNKKIKKMEFTIEQFKEINKGNENLGAYFGEWTPELGFPFVFNEKKVQENFELYKAMQNNRSLKIEFEKKPLVGDVIYLPDNKMVYICRVSEPNIQTTQGGSFSVFSYGSMDYSGGLDSGLKTEDLVESDEQDFCSCWFPEGGKLRAHSAVQAKIKVRVWKVKEDADLSGVWKSIERKTQN